MPFILAIIACALIVSCGETSPTKPHPAARAPHAQEASQCHADVAVKDWTEHTGERRASLDFTLTLDGPGTVLVPYSVDADGMPILGLVSAYNAKDAGTGSGVLKLVAEDGWETLQAAKANQVRLGGIISLSGAVGSPSSVSIAGQPCTLTVNNVAHFTPPPAQDKAPPPPSEAPTFAAAPAAPAASPPASASNPLFGTDAQRATVQEYMRKLMDETRIVPDTAARKGGPRGSAGSFAKLSSAQVDEFVSAIIYGAKLFLPQSLKDEERWALVCAEISIESAFTPGTSGANPGDGSKVSVSPLQITIRGQPSGPGMWEDIMVQYADVPGLIHYDSSPWVIKGSDPAQLANSVTTSIFDGIIASLWCITEQGRRGCPDWLGGPDGPCPKNMHTSFLAWVIGGPALKSGGDLAGQRDFYLASIGTDLKLIGFSEDLINSSF